MHNINFLSHKRLNFWATVYKNFCIQLPRAHAHKGHSFQFSAWVWKPPNNIHCMHISSEQKVHSRSFLSAKGRNSILVSSMSSCLLNKMATSSSKAALSKLKSQLICPVCLDQYTDPRVLPCAHCFCKDCIDHLPVELENGRYVVRCPTCRQPSEMRERGAAGLPVPSTSTTCWK